MLDDSKLDDDTFNDPKLAHPELSFQEMEHLKTLARLELRGDETEALKGDLNKLLGFFEQLSELDTEGVDELVRPISSANVFRDDTPRAGLTQRETEALATESEGGFFKVPRTVDTGE